MDFLKTFVCDGGRRCLKEEPVDEENVELSLGLSLNGRFGVERRRFVTNNHDYNNRLIRASSVVNFSLVTENEATLTRTCSLPIATEEWKKKKELQSLRRSEAKRKRVEKLKNGRVVNEENCEMKRRKIKYGNELLPPLPRLSSVGSPGSGGSSGVSDLETQPAFSGMFFNLSILILNVTYFYP